MKYITPLFITCAIASVGLFTTGTANAAFIIATDGSLGLGNYAYTGPPSGSVASTSTASAGNLPATTDPTPTFFTLGHVFGGNGTTDEYTFTYTPAVDLDNVSFSLGTDFNSVQGLSSSGLSNGAAGFYDVYRIHPANPGVSGGNTTYQVSVNSGLELTETIDQNAANLGTGENIGRWELIGSVSLLSDTDTVTVTMTPDSSTFVSMRASGIMFEYTAPIPEPSRAMLSLLGLGGVLVRRRR